MIYCFSVILLIWSSKITTMRYQSAKINHYNKVLYAFTNEPNSLYQGNWPSKIKYFEYFFFPMLKAQSRTKFLTEARP